jgi:hypothetical protein
MFYNINQQCCFDTAETYSHITRPNLKELHWGPNARKHKIWIFLQWSAGTLETEGFAKNNQEIYARIYWKLKL